MEWYRRSTEEVLQMLETGEQGLHEDEVGRRLAKYGPNEIKEARKTSPAEILLRQFKNVLVLILLAAIALSIFVGEILDAAVILVIVVFIAVLGFAQEYRAEKAIEAIKDIAAPRARVIRAGEIKNIPARELVPGDIILLSPGSRVPADARLLEAMELALDEAVLTGESASVRKTIDSIGRKVVPGDMRNMVFNSTIVITGRGRAVVTATGMDTEFGKIAAMLQAEKEPPTPLEVRLGYVGRWVGLAALAIVVIVTGAEVLVRGEPPLEMLIWGTALAVAAVPEALPAVVTGALAMGMRRMSGRNAIIRKLPAVETLGSVTVICSDKTGTLTRNEMVVREIYAWGETVRVTGEGFKLEGKFYLGEVEILPGDEIKTVLRIGALCNDAVLKRASGQVLGDPTEGALLVSAAKAGMYKKELEKEYPRIGEIPFSSERKRMVTVHRMPLNNSVAFMKGAPEAVLERCEKVYRKGGVFPLKEEEKLEILEVNRAMASRGLRILATAFKPLSEKFLLGDADRGLIFAGLQGMLDAPREEAKRALMTCTEAGIKTVMITGDHIATAQAVARELGIHGKALTGSELDALDEEKLREIVEDISVYARVSPEHKVRILRALKARGHIVAMTGDGVNDAPALKLADIGIAMGITGTDVTKEASDMVLVDDNFASIVAAVEEGRRVYDNIKKYLLFLLSCNAGEVLFLFLAALLDFPLPLFAIHILYINLATDGLPALALGVDPAERDVMRRVPRTPTESVFREIRHYIAALSIYLTAVALPLFYWALINLGLEKARSMVFAAIIFFELFNAFNCRSISHSILGARFFANRWLVLTVVWEFLLLNAVIFLPFFNNIMHTTPLSGAEYAIALALGASAIGFMEVLKTRRGH